MHWYALPWAWLKHRRRIARLKNRSIGDAEWANCLAHYPFLPAHPRLRELASLLLASKEFSTVAPLVLTDEKAIAVVAQAAVLILGISLRDEAAHALRAFDAVDLFDDFVGIVLHPSDMLARRSSVDEAGVSHHWREALSGEALDGGPLALSWQDVSEAGASMADGYNVVIHEFAHVLDMRSGHANGVPALPNGFQPLGSSRLSGGAARAHWQAVIQTALEQMQERLSLFERFGGEKPWLDEYAATDAAEFFAVAAEAYCVNPGRFSDEWPELMPMFDAYFNAWRWR